MITKKLTDQSGVSIIEVLIIVVLVTIIAVFAVAQFGNTDKRFQTQNIARELKVNLERARFDSVKRRPAKINDMARVVINDATSFSVAIDQNQNQLLETFETNTVDFSSRTNVKIIAPGISFPVSIVFDRKGHITATDSTGTNITPTFTVCDNCNDQNINPNESFLISVSPTGTVAMLKSNESLPTLTNPSTTNLGNGAYIDEMVAVQGNGTVSTGTPVPTPTPDPTPTITPTPTPTSSPSPTPTSTPTPTPTPRVCQRNERPEQTGCYCQPPMTVHGNGQCK